MNKRNRGCDGLPCSLAHILQPKAAQTAHQANLIPTSANPIYLSVDFFFNIFQCLRFVQPFTTVGSTQSNPNSHPLSLARSLPTPAAIPRGPRTPPPLALPAPPPSCPARRA